MKKVIIFCVILLIAHNVFADKNDNIFLGIKGNMVDLGELTSNYNFSISFPEAWYVESHDKKRRDVDDSMLSKRKVQSEGFLALRKETGRIIKGFIPLITFYKHNPSSKGDKENPYIQIKIKDGVSLSDTKEIIFMTVNITQATVLEPLEEFLINGFKGIRMVTQHNDQGYDMVDALYYLFNGQRRYGVLMVAPKNEYNKVKDDYNFVINSLKLQVEK